MNYLMNNRIKKIAKCAILFGMATLGQIITAETRSQRPANLPKSETISKESSKKTKQQEMKENEFSPPIFIPTETGIYFARRFSRNSVSQVDIGNDPIKIENISEMPKMREKTYLNILSRVPRMKEVQERINKFIKHLKNKDLRYAMIGEGKDLDPSVKQLPCMFREYEDGILTIKIFDKKAHKIKEIGFDKNEQLVSPSQTSPKRIYRYYDMDKDTFLCMKTQKGAYIMVELGQLSQQHPIISARDSKGVGYINYGALVQIMDGENIHIYRRTIQELQQKQKIQDKHQESTQYGNYAETSSQRPTNFSKSNIASKEASKKEKQQEIKESEFSLPTLMTPTNGIRIATNIMRNPWIQEFRDDKSHFIKIENISEMPEIRKKACLNILSSVHRLKEVQGRVNKFIKNTDSKDLKYATIPVSEDLDYPIRRLPKILRENEDSVLTLNVFDKKAHKIKEIGFDKNGRLVLPKHTSSKRVYRYFCADKHIFLCAKILNDKNISNDDEYIMVELGQLNQQYPIISAKDSKGVEYMSFGTSVRIDDGENTHIYRGAIQELQQKQK